MSLDEIKCRQCVRDITNTGIEFPFGDGDDFPFVELKPICTCFPVTDNAEREIIHDDRWKQAIQQAIPEMQKRITRECLALIQDACNR